MSKTSRKKRNQNQTKILPDTSDKHPDRQTHVAFVQNLNLPHLQATARNRNFQGVVFPISVASNKSFKPQIQKPKQKFSTVFGFHQVHDFSI
jgi:hypothetical protein